MREKRIILFMFLMISLMIVILPRNVEAADWELESNDYNILAGNWYKIYDNMTTGDVFSGFFETHSEIQGLDFFICDSTNLLLWEEGNPATIYNDYYNYHYLGFSFTVPYTDTWYAVYSNRDGSSSVTADFGADLNGDSTPDYSGYDTSDYAVVLEPGDYETRVFSCGINSTFSGIVSTWFSTDYIDVFFCDADNYNIFAEGGTPTVYSLVENVHSTTFDFAVPENGAWYLVFSAVGESDTITISYGLDYYCLTYTTTTTSLPTTTTTTTTRTTTTTATSTSTTVEQLELGGFGFVIIGAGLLILIAAAVVCSRRRPGPLPAPGAYEVITPIAGPGTAVERPPPTTHAPRVLVICPYCGAKTEQGILECQNCGAEL